MENRKETVKKPYDKRDNLKKDAGPGRPMGQRNYATLYREALLKLAEINKKTPIEIETDIVSNALIAARKGDYRFYKDILDRLYGTPINTTQLSGLNGQPIKIDAIPDDKFREILTAYANKPTRENPST